MMSLRYAWFLGGTLSLATIACSADNLSERPLAARSGPRGATMFMTMAPSATGVATENRYSDPKMWWERYQEFSVGAIGTGVAVGDYDADGRPDLFVVSKTGGNRLFRNLGDWRFEDVTKHAGVDDPTEDWKQGAAFADIDNDGWLDLYVCRFAAPNLLYRNLGNGTFHEEAAARGLALSDASSMAAFADYDRDGWLDVYVQTNLLDAAAQPHGQRDRLYRNDGDGTFTEVTDRAGIAGETQGHSATWWDYDNDGWPDLYVANDFAPPDSLYHNNRDGTFTNRIARVVPHTPFSAMGADLGDVNNDGLIDFLVADMAASTHEKDQRGMADSRARAREPREPASAAPQYLRNALFLNTDTGFCLESAILAGLAATDWTWSARFEDLDNDGRLDLHVTNGMVRELHNADILAGMMASESPAARVRKMRESPVLAEPNLAFRNLGDLRFASVGAAWGLDQAGVSFGAAFGDFDGDGDLDLAFTNYEAGVTVLRNDCDSGHRVTFALRGTVSNRFGVGATVRLESDSGVQVRQLVLARGYLSSSEPILHFGLGADDRMQRVTVAWPSGSTQVFTDLPADRHFTVTEPVAKAGSGDAGLSSRRTAATAQFVDVSEVLALVMRENVVDEFARQPLLPARYNRRGPGLAVGDLDADGIDDVWLGGTPRDPAQVMLRAATGGFVAQDNRSLFASNLLSDGPGLIFDVNGDGANDLLITKGGSVLPAGASAYQPLLFLNQHGGVLQRATDGALPPLPVSAGAVAAADFDRDGRLDVFLGGRVAPGQFPATPRSALLANRGGTLADVTGTHAPGLGEVGMVTSALWTDADGDGWLDLLVALEWGGVRYWRNQAGRGFADHSENAGFAAAGTGWWTSLAAADFNGDGRSDFVAGNVGLNTTYHASPEHPALLFHGDFKGGGPPQIVEAYYEGERLVPRRNRRQLAIAAPAILQRFPMNDDYAGATLGELLGEDRLAAARRLAATELRSGVFFSQPDGRYRFSPLPRIAQIAPLQGIVAGDFDGDGHADIFAVQNSYAPSPVVGRFDGGLSQLLRGDGRGNFHPVPPAESGLVVPGDAKALVVLDLDQNGWPDFLVTRNHDTSLAFRNQGVVGRNFLRVVLRGPGGNATAIGSRVTVQLADGSTQMSETCAGSGYYGQSTAACFFGFAGENPPKSVQVRWPAGEVTQHEVPAGVKTLTLTQP